MAGTNLKIAAVVVATLLVYTGVANMIPQIESDVPVELDLSEGVTAEQLVAAGEDLFKGAGGCTACHGLGTRAPDLLSSEGGAGPIGARCASRVSGKDCKAYLYESLTEPGAYLLEGYNPIMPDVRRILSSDQIWALVAFLQSQGGDVTVTADDVGSAAPAAPAAPAASAAGPALPTTNDPEELLEVLGCFACHQLGDKGNAIGPPLTDVGARRDASYIRQSILDPAAEIAPGYEAFAGIMPATLGERMTAVQLEAIVQYLAARK